MSGAKPASASARTAGQAGLLERAGTLPESPREQEFWVEEHPGMSQFPPTPYISSAACQEPVRLEAQYE